VLFKSFLRPNLFSWISDFRSKKKFFLRRDWSQTLKIAGCGILMGCGSSLFPPSVFSKKTGAALERSIGLYNMKTGEHLHVVYWRKGEYLPKALQKINHILRDHRTGEVKKIDVRLIELMFSLKKELNYSLPFKIISGYRSPRSNQRLRQKSRGVARKSYHIKGQAVDIAFSSSMMHKACRILRSLKKGGVGFYRRSGFIHMDVRGSPSFWSS
jgi:uncharacterized protein YcbK (DUF882 family)